MSSSLILSLRASLRFHRHQTRTIINAKAAAPPADNRLVDSDAPAAAIVLLLVGDGEASWDLKMVGKEETCVYVGSLVLVDDCLRELLEETGLEEEVELVGVSLQVDDGVSDDVVVSVLWVSVNVKVEVSVGKSEVELDEGWIVVYCTCGSPTIAVMLGRQ
jgi:hypothetical protein